MDFNNIIQLYQGSNKSRHILFSPTTWCNYACSYCAQGHKKESRPSEQKLIEISKSFRETLNIIDSKYPRKYEHLVFLGGEIGFYDMYKILEPLITNKTNSISITSNFSAPNQNYINVAKKIYARNIPCAITFSFHEEHTTVDDFINKFIELRHFFIQNPQINCTLCTQITITDHNIKIANQFLDKAKKLNIKTIVSIERKPYGTGMKHSEKSKELVIKNANIGTSSRLTMQSGETITVLKEVLLSNCDKTLFPSENYICKDRFSEVRFAVGHAQLKCKLKDNILDEPNEVKCFKTGCNLCGRVVLEKITDSKL